MTMTLSRLRKRLVCALTHDVTPLGVLFHRCERCGLPRWRWLR